MDNLNLISGYKAKESITFANLGNVYLTSPAIVSSTGALAKHLDADRDSVDDINTYSFLKDIDPTFDFLVIAYGDRHYNLQSDIRKLIREHNLMIECLSVPIAFHTWNILLEDDYNCIGLFM